MLVYIAIALVLLIGFKLITKKIEYGIVMSIVGTLAFYVGYFGMNLTSGNGHNYLEYKWGITGSMQTDILFGAVIPLICLIIFCVIGYKLFKSSKNEVAN